MSTPDIKDPADAVPVYQRMVEPIISRMKNDAYDEATRMVEHIRPDAWYGTTGWIRSLPS